jgi:hypothetical protein
MAVERSLDELEPELNACEALFVEPARLWKRFTKLSLMTLLMLIELIEAS